MRSSHRPEKFDHKGRPLPLSLAMSEDRAAMQFHQMEHNREPQPQPPKLLRAGVVGLAEALKDIGEKVGADPDSGVADNDFHVGIDSLQPDLDLPALGVNLIALERGFQMTCCKRFGSP